MGETSTACLLRSFSHPSDALRQHRESDPLRCLTESFSFGRYISDSLAWEKWSTFSHNRYLEEVEKFFKPGSVAEKRAFFEARYRKKAAAKVAALQPIEARVASGVVQGSENTYIARDNSSVNLNSAKANNQVASDGENAKVRPAAKVSASQFTEASTGSGTVQESENTHIERDNSSIDLNSAKANNQVASYGEKSEARKAAKVAASQFTEASAASGVVQESENTRIARDKSSNDLDSAKANNLVASYGEEAGARAAASQFTEASPARGVVQESENTHIATDKSSNDLDPAKANSLVASYGEKAEARAGALQSEEVSAGTVHESENTNLAQENSSADLDPSEANNLVQSDEQYEEDMPDVCGSNGEKAKARAVALQSEEVSAGAVHESENTNLAQENSSADLDPSEANNLVQSDEQYEEDMPDVCASNGEKAEARAVALQSEEVSAGAVLESENTNLAQENSSADLDPSEANNLVQSDEQYEEDMLDVCASNGEKAQARAVALQSEEVSAGVVHESENTNLTQENTSADLDPSEANNLVQSDEQYEEDMPDDCVENSKDADVLELNNSEDMLGAAAKDIVESSEKVSYKDLSQGEVICHSHLDNMKNHVEIRTSQSKEISVKEAVEEQISTSAEKKEPEASSSKLSIQKRSSKFPFSCAKERASLLSKNGKIASLSNDKSDVNTADKKKLTTKSLHMSINFASTKGNNNKTVSPVLPLIRKTNERKLPSVIRKDSSVLHKSSTLATNVDSEHASGIQKACTKRSEALHSKPISGGLVAVKSSEIKSPNALGSKVKFPTVCSPFRFRSEERAAKRKEKLEEKIDAKVEEKLQFHERFKKKEEQNTRKSQHGFGFKTRVNTESSQQMQSSNDLRKASHMESQPPRSGKKIASTSDQETKSKPPRQTSVNVNAKSFKNIKGKGVRMMTQSVTSLHPRNLHENASPNIQAHNERRWAV